MSKIFVKTEPVARVILTLADIKSLHRQFLKKMTKTNDFDRKRFTIKIDITTKAGGLKSFASIREMLDWSAKVNVSDFSAIEFIYNYSCMEDLGAQFKLCTYNASLKFGKGGNNTLCVRSTNEGWVEEVSPVLRTFVNEFERFDCKKIVATVRTAAAVASIAGMFLFAFNIFGFATYENLLAISLTLGSAGIFITPSMPWPFRKFTENQLDLDSDN